jgi:hypothetical protein
MKRMVVFFIMLMNFSLSWAADSSSTVLPAVRSLTKSTTLYYFTFFTTTNPQLVQTATRCPKGALFIPGSLFEMPKFTGIPAGYMYQCMVPLGDWAEYGTFEKGILDSTGLDRSQLTNLEIAINQSRPPGLPSSWQVYNNPAIPNTRYTAYQFPDNAYIPSGVSGSGIQACGSGGQSIVTCKSGGIDIRVTPLNPGSGFGPFYFYLGPNQAVTCTIHRDYGPGSKACDGGYPVQAGNALVGACCFGKWVTSTTYLDDPNLNTCFSCPPS